VVDSFDTMDLYTVHSRSLWEILVLVLGIGKGIARILGR
jgi:hypothetical protein